MTIEEFLASVRKREPGIRRSVDLWARQTLMPTEKVRRKYDGTIAPDGRPYAEPFTPFKMLKPRGDPS